MNVLEPETSVTIAFLPETGSERSSEVKLSGHEAQNLSRVLRGAMKVRTRTEVLAKAARRGAEFVTVN